MGHVVHGTYLKMEALANATQLVMQTKRAPAAPQLAGAETVMRTAKGMEALTIVTVSTSLPSRHILISHCATYL